MSMLPDDTYDAIVIDAEQAENADIRLELTITLGPQIRTCDRAPWSPCRHASAEIADRFRSSRSPRNSRHLDRSRGCSVVPSGGRVTARVTATCRPRTFARVVNQSSPVPM